MSAIFDYLSASALSLVVSGNTGVSPFLSLFIVGTCEKMDPTLLNMTGNMEALLSSWPALIFLGVMTTLEFLAKCIPVIDEIVASAMVFLVPVMSAVGSLATFGVFDSIYANIDLDEMNMNNVEVNYNDDAGGAGRLLEDAGAVAEASGTSTALMVLQVCLVVIGIGLALLIHLFKMIIRLLGEGCLTNCITVMETTWIATTVTIAIYIREVAVAIAILLGFAAAYSFKRHIYDKRMKKNEEMNRSITAEEAPATVTREIPHATAPDESLDKDAVETDYVVLDEAKE